MVSSPQHDGRFADAPLSRPSGGSLLSRGTARTSITRVAAGARRLASTTVVLVVVAAAIAGAQDWKRAELAEYDVKTALLINFARFTEWPAEAFESAGDAIDICVIGPDMEESMRKVAANLRVGARPMRLRMHDFKSRCHLLFITAGAQARAAAVLAALDGSTLTVGEHPQFLAQGGVVNLYIEDGRVRFTVNRDVLAHARYRLSSKVLELAAIRPGDSSSRPGRP